MMNTRCSIILNSLVVVALLAGVGAGTASASAVFVIGGLTREATLQPGGRTEGRIILRNNSNEPQEVKVYQTDYLFWADGRNEYGEPGSTPRSNAPWIVHTPQQLTVPPKGTGSVDYALQVPAQEGLSGTSWSVLMVEPIAAETLEPPKAEEGKVTIGIRTVMRYAIQMVTHIGDTGARELKFADKQLIVEKEKRLLRLDLENTGERWLVPQVWAELYDEQGTSLGRFEGGRFRIYPGCSVRYQIDLSEVPPGKYRALIVADNGDEYVFGAQYDLEITETGQGNEGQ